MVLKFFSFLNDDSIKYSKSVVEVTELPLAKFPTNGQVHSTRYDGLKFSFKIQI